VHRSKRRAWPEFGKINAKQKAKVLTDKCREDVSALANPRKSVYNARCGGKAEPQNLYSRRFERVILFSFDSVWRRKSS
jgi:hypothetical protein